MTPAYKFQTLLCLEAGVFCCCCFNGLISVSTTAEKLCMKQKAPPSQRSAILAEYSNLRHAGSIATWRVSRPSTSTQWYVPTCILCGQPASPLCLRSHAETTSAVLFWKHSGSYILCVLTAWRVQNILEAGMLVHQGKDCTPLSSHCNEA